MPWRLLLRRALNLLSDSQRLSENATLRRAAQLVIYQWTKIVERSQTAGQVGVNWLESRGQERLARLARNFAKNLREEMKKIGGGRGQ